MREREATTNRVNLNCLRAAILRKCLECLRFVEAGGFHSEINETVLGVYDALRYAFRTTRRFGGLRR